MDCDVKKEIVSSNVKIENLPKRIKGTMSQSSNKKFVVSNYFPVKVKPFKNIYIFKITFEPYIMHDNRKLRREILNEAFPSIKEKIKNPVIGGANIYSVNEPEIKETQYTVREYKIRVKLVKNFNVFDNPKVMIHFLNNGIRNIMDNLKYLEIGKTGKYFNMNKKTKLEEDLILFPGFKANFLLGEGGLFLRVDPANKIVQKNTVLDYINMIYSNNKSKEREQKRQKIKEALINKIIMTNYGKTRYVKIEDIEFEPLESIIIGIKNGNSIVQNLNIIDYFTKKYHAVITKTNQPLLVIQNKNRGNTDQQKILMLPELCLMTGLPQDMDDFKRRKVSEATIVTPQEKYQKIKQFMSEIKNDSEQHSLVDLGIQIAAQSHKVEAQIIPPPILKLHGNTRIQTGKQSFFNITNQKLYYSDNRINAAIIQLDSDVSEMIDTFKNTAPKLGLTFSYKIFKIQEDKKSREDLQNHIFKCVEKAIEQDFNCCVVVIKSFMKLQYKDIKKRCLEDYQIITQVVVDTTLLKKSGRQSIHTKILLQLAAKMGNILWQPSVPSALTERSPMVLSFNVSKKGGSRKLVGVGSSDKYFSAYFSESVDLLEPANRFKQMVSIVMKLLNRYLKRNSHLPKQLIILTDSCPKNEINMIYEHFIPQFRQKMQQISTNQLKLTIIHANDICSSRFFLQRQKFSGLENSPPGLLISNSVVSENYDFFLVSQKSNKGCVVPIHFNVVYSDSVLEQGIIHQLMYGQCFNYFGWTGSIKIPAVMQYAKKFARFCSQNLKKNIDSDNLVKRLYYI